MSSSGRVNGHATILAPAFPPPPGSRAQDQNAPPPVQDQNALPGSSTSHRQPLRVHSVTMNGDDDDDNDASGWVAGTQGAADDGSSEEEDDDDDESDMDGTPLHSASPASAAAALQIELVRLVCPTGADPLAACARARSLAHSPQLRCA